MGCDLRGREGRGRTSACTDDWFPIFDLGSEGVEDLLSICWRAHFWFSCLVLVEITDWIRALRSLSDRLGILRWDEESLLSICQCDECEILEIGLRKKFQEYVVGR